MYVDFNGKRLEIGREFVAALITAVIILSAVAVWQLWPRQAAVVNVERSAPVVRQTPVQQPATQMSNEEVERARSRGRLEEQPATCLTNQTYDFDRHQCWPPRVPPEGCLPGGVYSNRLGRCVPL